MPFSVNQAVCCVLQLHAVVMAMFASIIAPFGGFFASGFKRGFKIKDFGDSIPGHGGMTDRMDCQVMDIATEETLRDGVSFLRVRLRQCQLPKYVHGHVACSGLPWCNVWVPQIQARWYAWQQAWQNPLSICRPAQIPQEPTRSGMFHTFPGQMQASF